MTARTGMTNLIATLRGMAQAGTAEFTLGSLTFFTDDQLQQTLDLYREDVYQLPLVSEPHTGTASVAIYTDLYFPAGYWEEASGGTAIWAIQDSTGALLGTADYTVNYDAGHVHTTADTLGTAYYLTARQYDLHRAAGDIWRKKAAAAASGVNWSSDNHSFSSAQKYDHYMQMAALFDGQAPARVTTVTRGDVW